jgi:phage baseplate assembly protein gpV
MTRRAALIVAGLAVIAIVLALVGQRQNRPDTFTGTLLVPGLAEALNDIERVTVTGARAETIATLVRGEAGWSVVEKAGYAADLAKIRQALVGLSEARIVEEKTSNPDFHARLGVEAVEAEGATGVAIAIEAPTEFPVLILGDEPNSASRYARRAAEQASFLIDRNPEIPSTTTQWLETEIVDVPSASVESVTIKHSDGDEIAISKASAAESNFTVAGIPEGRELSYPTVANVIGNALRELKLHDVAPAVDAAVPSVVTEFRTFDGLVVTVTSTLDGEMPWLAFAARAETSVSPDAADAEEPGAAADEASEAATESAPGAAPSDTAAPDPVAAAEAINARVGGWRYRIPEYQHGQLTRRWADLLKAPE